MKSLVKHNMLKDKAVIVRATQAYRERGEKSLALPEYVSWVIQPMA
jgi:hypothetical protein